MSFAGKVAVVTGGASGIGLALCKQLVRGGARVVVADVDETGAARAASELGTQASGRAVDVRDPDAVQELVVDTASEHGVIDYMFNNAGIAVVGEVVDTSPGDWTRVIDINVRGVVHGVSAAYPQMIEQGHGHIVNTASIAGLIACPGLAAYSATKHAVVGLSRGLRIEAARYGVKVSAVCPGFVKTNIVHNATVRGMERGEAENAPPFWYDVDDCARDILRGVRRNMGIIVVTGHGKHLYRLSRFAPRVIDWLGGRLLERQLRSERA